MANFNEQLNTLFDKWEAESNRNGETGFFCRDGLMYKYGHDKSYVDQLWEKSKKRIMFLLKDPKEPSGDSREWLYFDGDRYLENRNLQPKIMKVLAFWLYGLSTAKDGKIAELETVTEEQLVTCFNETPFAYVESKKQHGGTSIADGTLREKINLYKEYLTEEINILNPDIIVCCGTPQYNFVLKLYEGAEKIDNNVFFHREKNKLILYSYHPSYYKGEWNDPKTFYRDLMSQYSKFLARYPDFQ